LGHHENLVFLAEMRHRRPMGSFEISPNLNIEVRSIGQSAEPMLVIDDFLTDPTELVDHAAKSEWTDLPPGGYPGQRAGLPRGYVQSVLRRLDGPIRDKLIPDPAKLGDFMCSFSMVTRKPADLADMQRVPHIDVAMANRVAILHYLCDATFGGTAFFRQDATGFEQISPENRASYSKARSADIARLQAAHAYPDQDTPGYTRTSFVNARFNRVVAYRSFTLHSGIIDHPDALVGDPRLGRLTANFFVDYEPVGGD